MFSLSLIICGLVHRLNCFKKSFDIFDFNLLILNSVATYNVCSWGIKLVLHNGFGIGVISSDKAFSLSIFVILYITQHLLVVLYKYFDLINTGTDLNLLVNALKVITITGVIFMNSMYTLSGLNLLIVPLFFFIISLSKKIKA